MDIYRNAVNMVLFAVGNLHDRVTKMLCLLEIFVI